MRFIWDMISRSAVREWGCGTWKRAKLAIGGLLLIIEFTLTGGPLMGMRNTVGSSHQGATELKYLSINSCLSLVEGLIWMSPAL